MDLAENDEFEEDDEGDDEDDKAGDKEGEDADADASATVRRAYLYTQCRGLLALHQLVRRKRAY